MLVDSFVCDNVLFQSAFAVAFVNIQIPLILGDVVNVVSKFTRDAAGNFMDDIKQPALKLIQMYTLQVAHRLCNLCKSFL